MKRQVKEATSFHEIWVAQLSVQLHKALLKGLRNIHFIIYLGCYLLNWKTHLQPTRAQVHLRCVFSNTTHLSMHFSNREWDYCSTLGGCYIFNIWYFLYAQHKQHSTHKCKCAHQCRRHSPLIPPFKYMFSKGGDPLRIYKEKVSLGGHWQRFHAVKTHLYKAWDLESVSDNCSGSQGN